MATFTSLKQYRKTMKARMKAIQKAGDKGSMAASKFMVANAKRLAPRQTGTLIRGIRKRKRKNGLWTVESWVPGTFKYNKWVNQSRGFRTLTYTKPNRQFGIKTGDRLVYGRSPANWRWTGTPRFFDLAAAQTRRMFGRTVRKETRKAMQVRV